MNEPGLPRLALHLRRQLEAPQVLVLLFLSMSRAA